MKYTARYFVVNLLTVLLLAISGNVYASHIVGLDLYYTHLSGSTYKITLIAYGDCGPASSGAFASLPAAAPVVCVYNGSTSVASVTLAIQAPSTGVEITPVCHADSLLTQCTNTSYAIPGIKKFVYSANYTVPTTSAVWRFIFTGNMGAGSGSAGRAAAITNIAGGTTSQLVDTLNNTVYTNSNAILTTVPVPFFCLNNNDSYNPGAVDPDGDSLSFFLIPGMNGSANCSTAGTTVTYTGGYTGAAPLGVLTGSFSLDQHTGQISFVPNILQRALVVYNIEEFRGGSFVGSCQREMTFLVLTCTDLPPSGIISGSTSTGGTLTDSTHFKICQNSGPFSLTINPTEADTSNTITVSATGLPAGSAITVVNNGTNHPNCTFSWTSTGVAPGTYIFYLTFRDNACPISGTQTRAYTIIILPQPTIHASGGAALCLGASTLLTATGGISYSWTPGTGLSCPLCATTTATPAATSLYTVTGTDANGCRNTDTISVRVNPLPVISAGSNVSYCIGGSTVLTATGGVSYAWTPATGLSCTTCSNPTANPAVTTTYTVTGTDANGCQNMSTVTVSVNPLPIIDAGPHRNICMGTAITITATGGISYTWSPGTGLSCTTCDSPVASPAVTTTYTVTGTSTAGCSNTDTMSITVNPLPVVDAGPNVSICAGSGTVLTGTGGVSYTWSPGTGLSCTACSSTTANPTGTILYTVTGTDANGCINTDTVRVTVKPLPVIDAGPNVSICSGAGTVLTGTGGVSYTWTPGTGLSCTTCSSAGATPAGTTVYTLTGTGANGCVNTDTVRVTVNPLPTIGVSPGVAICTGTSTVLSGTGGTTYSWTPATGLSCTTCATTTAGPTVTTTYTLTGTSAAGCSNTATVTVSVNPTATISTSPAVTICSGTSAVITATGGSTYSWSPATGLSCSTCATTTSGAVITTTYTVTGTTTTGCSGYASVTITVNPIPTITAAPVAPVCSGSSVILTAGGGATYSWSPPTGLSCTTCATTTASPTVTTTYIVTGTSAAGCSNTASVTVSVNPLPVIHGGSPTTLCLGSGITLTGTGGVSYTWSPGTGLSCTACTGTTASPTVTTVYTVTGTDANGCKNKDTIRITVYSSPVINAGPNVSICPGSGTVLTPTGGVSYVWATGTGLSCTSCTGPVASPATTTLYTVTGTDAFGCHGTDTVRVTVRPLPVIDAGPHTHICVGSATTLTATGGVSYVWTPGTGLSCTSCTSPVASPGTTTIYTVAGTDINGCRNTDTVSVTVNPLPAIGAGPVTAICNGLATTLTATGGSSYIWSPGTGLSCTTCTSTTASPATTTTYTVTGTDANGCVNATTVVLTVYLLPVINAGPDVNICTGSSTTLVPSGGLAYVWGPGTGLSCTYCANPVATPLVTTVYTVTGTDAYGCRNWDTMRVIVHTLPMIDAGPAVSICAGSSTTLSPAGGVSYLWSPGTGLSCTPCTNPVASPGSTIVYTVTGTDAFGCKNKDTVSVIVKPLPVIDAGPTVSICNGASTTLTPAGGVSYIWTASPGLSCSSCTSPVASPAVTTIYTVTGTDISGCSNKDTVRVIVNPLPVINAGPSVSICIGQSTTLTATGGASYAWSPGTGLSCSVCTSPVATPAVTTVYTVTGISPAGCVGWDTMTVYVNPLPVITLSPGAAKCIGDYYAMTAAGGGSYSWTPSTGLSCGTCSAPVATPVVTTTYTVTVTSTFGCINTAMVTVTINPLPVITITPNPLQICAGSDTTITATGALNYVWSPGAGLSTTTGSAVIAGPGSSTTYTITGTDANNCSNFVTEAVTVVPVPAPPVVVSPVKYCISVPAAALIATGTNLLWYTAPAGGAGSTVDPVPSTSGPGTTWYYVSQTVNGCMSPMDSIDVIVDENVITGFDVLVFPGCNFDSVSLVNHSLNATHYLWTFHDGTTDTAINPSHLYNPVADTTIYYVKLYGSNNVCFPDSTIKPVKLYTMPPTHFLHDITVDQAIWYGKSIQLGVQGAWIYYWQPNDGTLNDNNINTPVATPFEKTTYTVFGYLHSGCKDSAQVTIDVLTTKELIPSAFTPDGDGKNDIFQVVNLQYGKLVEMRIFNRWGQVVCKTNDNNKGWDGTFNGVPQDLGVYGYLITVERENHQQVVYKGDVTLIR